MITPFFPPIKAGTWGPFTPEAGAALFDYYVGTAGNPPAWYEPAHDWPGSDQNPKPRTIDIERMIEKLPEIWQEHARAWVKDPCFDLSDPIPDAANPFEQIEAPESVTQFEDNVHEYNIALAEWDRLRKIDRVVAWRVDYALRAMMVREKVLAACIKEGGKL